MPILVLDVGNTRLKWGVYEAPQHGSAVLAHGAMPLEQIGQLRRVLSSAPRPDVVIGCAVAGAVVTGRVCAELNVLGLACSWITAQAEQCGVRNGYTTPALLGADRWASMIGAHRHLPGRALLTISVGTAVTMDALTADGEFLGGVVMPGFGLMLKALEMGTAGLRVPEGQLREFPINTSDALMTGGAMAISGAAGLMAQRMERRLGVTPQVVLTGGAAPKLGPALGMSYQLVEHLVFDGLLCIAAEQLRPIRTVAMAAQQMQQ